MGSGRAPQHGRPQTLLAEVASALRWGWHIVSPCRAVFLDTSGQSLHICPLLLDGQSSVLAFISYRVGAFVQGYVRPPPHTHLWPDLHLWLLGVNSGELRFVHVYHWTST